MKAMVLVGHGDMDKLVYKDMPVPQPGPGEVLIRVGACGLNNTDVNTRTAWYYNEKSEQSGDDKDGGWGGAPITFPRIQGADAVGAVTAVGEGADESLVGKRVLIDTWLRDWSDPLNMNKCGYYGSEADGGFAEYTKVDARNVHPVESDLSDAELATFATSSVTAENMLNKAHVAEGDVVLIPGASGGVGSALIQLAKRRGAKTLAMCGSSKAEQVRAVGADAVLPRDTPSLRDEIAKLGYKGQVTVVADVVGGDMWPQFIDVLARGGRYTCAGAIAGAQVDFDLRTFYLRDLVFTGATVVPPGTFADLVGYIERGEIHPLLALTYPLAELHAAQTAFIEKKHVGNIVVTP